MKDNINNIKKSTIEKLRLKTMQSPALTKAMEILQQLRSISEGESPINEKLNNIVQMIAEQMSADAAACYITVEGNRLALVAAYQLNPEAVNKVVFRFGEGLTGEVAQQSRTLSVADAWAHPKFVHKPELGEDEYKSYIGIPLIRWHRSIGVLALQSKEIHEYSAMDIEILETVGMVLSEIVSSEDMGEYRKEFDKNNQINYREKLKGLSLSKGYGLGVAVVHRRRQVVTKIFAEDKEKELHRLEIAFAQMNADLEKKLDAAKLGMGEHVDILDAYKMFASDKGWYKKLVNNIQSGLTAEAAVERAYEDMWNRLSGTTDVYLKERLHDLRDVSDRLSSYLSGDYGSIRGVNSPDVVVVAQTMGPADLMDYDYTKIRGLIIEDGTPTMHVAIVAKALNIPVVAKIKGIFSEVKTGELIAVDGMDGYVYMHPSLQVQEKFKLKIAERQRIQAKLAELKELPAQTKDGILINLYLNVGLAFDLDYIETTNCDGIGLYRTEIPFMASEMMPDVDRQISYYKELMDRADNKKVIFRSLDVGSDKLLPYWGNVGEENPAIGWRSIRITLDRRAILRKQIRAFLRAAVGKELNVMFPMITNLSEFEEAKETLLLELEKEKKRTGEIPSKVNVGLMIEVPSVIFQLDSILEQADFISIGTNDLAQFVFACDRGNPRLTERYDVLSAPFLLVMKEIIDKANKHGVYCSVCGEMASNPIEAMALIGLGFRNLSMSGSSFGRVKSMVRSINVEEVADYVSNLLKSNKKTLRPQLISYAYDHGIEIY